MSNRYECYACVRNGRMAHTKGKKPSMTKQKIRNSFSQYTSDKETYLEKRLKYLLDKYKDDLKIKDEILGELTIYQCNMKIAKDLRTRKSIKRLNSDFIKFLQKF